MGKHTGHQDLEIDLTHYLDVLMRRRWIVAAGSIITFGAVVLYTFSMNPIFQASALLVIEKEHGGNAVRGDGVVLENTLDDYYQTQYKLLKSQSLLGMTYSKLQLEQTTDFRQPNGIVKLAGAISISPVLRSRLVYVNVESHEPELATRISNALAENFVRQNLSNQLFISKEVLEALQVQTPDAVAESTYESLPAVVNNQLIQLLKNDQAKLRSQYADMSARLTTKHPAMVSLKANLTTLESQIRIETAKIVQSLKTELSGQLRGNNVRIVDSAIIPDHPIKPRKIRMLAFGVILGLLIGVSSAFFVEVLDQTVRTQDDVEKKLDLAFLGMVPFARVQKTAYESLLATELSLSSESIRNLRTMVDFAGLSQKAKVFLVTSAVQSEGKSFIASNLAVAISQLGESVLILNGDLRRPSIQKVFSVSVDRGISDFLALGTNVEELPSLVKSTDIPNLKVMPCGPRPPNPSELLNTARLGALIDWAKENFDRVIVDCTPMFPIHDTMLWGRHIGAAVFVTRYGMTRAPLINRAKEQLQGAGIKILGVVVNGATAGGLTYSSYGYYYDQYYTAYETQKG